RFGPQVDALGPRDVGYRLDGARRGEVPTPAVVQDRVALRERELGEALARLVQRHQPQLVALAAEQVPGVPHARARREVLDRVDVADPLEEVAARPLLPARPAFVCALD